MTLKHKIHNITLTVFSLILLAVFLFPVYWMIITSLKTTPEIFARTPTFYPQNITFEGYEAQLFRATYSIWLNLKNSVLLGLFTMLISTSLATLSAYGLARYKLRVNRYVLFAFLLTQMLPTVLFLTPLFMIFRDIGILNSLPAPIIFTCLHGIPFCVITLRPYFLSIPRDLEDAAIIDGCNSFTTFIRIMIPISYPGILVSAAFTFLWGWGDLMGPLTFLQSDKLHPLTVNMYKAIGEYSTEWNSLMAFAVIITVPVLIIFIALQKYLVSGLTSGAVKG